MKYLFAYIDDNGYLKIDVLRSKESVKTRILELFGLDVLKQYKNNLDTLFKVVEIEPNYEFMNIDLVFPVNVEIIIK